MVAGRELVVVVSGSPPPPRLEDHLAPLLAGRFRVARASSADELEELAGETGDRWAAVGIGDGGAVVLEAVLAGARPEAVVLLAPRGSGQLLGRSASPVAVEIPILILGGEQDAAAPPAELERLQEALPSSSLGLLPGCADPLADAAETIGPMVLEYLRVRYLRAPHDHGGASGLVALQLERRPPWVDLAEYEGEDPEPVLPDPEDQEVGPGA